MKKPLVQMYPRLKSFLFVPRQKLKNRNNTHALNFDAFDTPYKSPGLVPYDSKVSAYILVIKACVKCRSTPSPEEYGF